MSVFENDPNMKIAYIMSRFPHLPETFILREMNELEKMGWNISLYPLIFQQQPVVHPDAQNWFARVKYSAYISPRILQANFSLLIKRPLLYLKLLTTVFIKNFSSPNFLFRSLLLYPKAIYFAQEMKNEGIEHIHAHYASYPAMVAWIIYQITGIQYSVTAHAHDIFARTQMLCEKMKDAAFVIVISEYNREHIASIVGEYVKEKTHVIHCGILPEKYTQANQRVSLQEPFTIICVGSLKPIKGQIHLIEACRILKEREIPFQCKIVGDGPEFPSIHERVVRYGLTDCIELMGSKNEEQVAEILPTGHCYVQPSLGEGIPVAVMEAFVSGLPVVATAYTGVKEVIHPGQVGYPVHPPESAELHRGLSIIYRDLKEAAQVANRLANHLISRAGIHELVIPNGTGYLVAPADPVGLADAIEKVYRNPEKAYQMAMQGKDLVLRDFDLRKNTKAIADLFEKINDSHHEVS